MIAAALYLAQADAYDFYIASAAKKAVRYTGSTGSVFTYLMRYLMANKSYLVNTAGLCGIACLLPLLFGGFQGLNLFPIGLAILCLNTPICTLLSSDPDLEQALRMLPGQAGRFCRKYGLFIFAVHGIVRRCLPVQLADHQRRNPRCPCGNASFVCPAERHSVGPSGIEASDPRLENRKRSVASSTKVSCSVEYDDACGVRRYVDAGALNMAGHLTDGVLRTAICSGEELTIKTPLCCPHCHSGISIAKYRWSDRNL